MVKYCISHYTAYSKDQWLVRRYYSVAEFNYAVSLSSSYFKIIEISKGTFDALVSLGILGEKNKNSTTFDFWEI